jgi:hypothetical protein
MILFLFLFPFQIRSLVYTMPFYATGGFDYYSSFFVYLGDVVFLSAFVLWGLSLWRKEQNGRFEKGDLMITFMLLALLLVMIGNVFLVQEPQLQFFMVFRFVELFLVYLMIVNRVVRQEQVVVCLLGGLCFQALVAFYQYVLQGSIGLSFLGEPIANSATLGMAKIEVGSQKILRAFGTFPHANVLGGFLFMGVMYAIALVKKYRWFVGAVVWLLTLGMLFSFSRGAFFALIAAFLLYISHHNKKYQNTECQH